MEAESEMEVQESLRWFHECHYHLPQRIESSVDLATMIGVQSRIAEILSSDLPQRIDSEQSKGERLLDALTEARDAIRLIIQEETQYGDLDDEATVWKRLKDVADEIDKEIGKCASK